MVNYEPELESPVNYIHVKAHDNFKFDHFFENSFMHYYLRAPEVADLDTKTRGKLAQSRCQQIQEMCTFLIGVDKVDPNVFYHYTAYFNSHQNLVIMMAYTKKNLRNFGIFKHALDLLCKDYSYYSYVFPLKNQKLDHFKRRLI